MKKIASLLLSFVLLLWAVPGYSQCSSGSCPIPSYPSYPSYPKLPSYPSVPSYSNPAPQAPSLQVSAEVKEMIIRASVRVKGVISSRLSGYGSGTLFRWPSRAADGAIEESVGVLTAGHVVEDAQQVFIIHQTLGMIPCEVLVFNSEMDYAILEPKEKQGELLKDAVSHYAGNPIPVQLNIVFAGFDSNSTVLVRGGRFTAYAVASGGRIFGSAAAKTILYEGDITEFYSIRGLRPLLGFRSKRGIGAPNWMKIVGKAYPGDSGGGLFTTDGRLLGNIWGSDMRNEVVGTWFSPAATELVEKIYVFSWKYRRVPPGSDKPPSVVPDPGPGSGAEDKPPSVVPDPGPGSGTEDRPPDRPPDKPSIDNPPQNKPPVTSEPSLAEKVWELLLPTVCVVLFYVSFLVTLGGFYLFKILWSKKA